MLRLFRQRIGKKTVQETEADVWICDGKTVHHVCRWFVGGTSTEVQESDAQDQLKSEAAEYRHALDIEKFWQVNILLKY